MITSFIDVDDVEEAASSSDGEADAVPVYVIIRVNIKIPLKNFLFIFPTLFSYFRKNKQRI